MLLFARELDSGGHAAVSRCLLSYGADVRRRNNTGETPLDRCRGTEVELVIRDTATKGYVFMILFKTSLYENKQCTFIITCSGLFSDPSNSFIIPLRCSMNVLSHFPIVSIIKYRNYIFAV